MFAKTLFFYCKKILIALIFIKKIYKFASIDNSGLCNQFIRTFILVGIISAESFLCLFYDTPVITLHPNCCGENNEFFFE